MRRRRVSRRSGNRRASNRGRRTLRGYWDYGAGAVNQSEVGAADAGLVRVVDDEASVAEEGANATCCRGKLVIVRNLERIRRDLAMLATQVTNLAGLREVGVADRVFATEERIQMGECFGAVAVTRDGIDMDMVGKGTALLGKVTESDFEPDADAVGIGSGCDGALDVASVGKGSFVEGGVGKSGLVNNTRRIVDNNGCVAKIASLDGLRRNQRNGSCREQRNDA